MTVAVGVTVRNHSNQTVDDALVRVYSWRGGNSLLAEGTTGTGGAGRAAFTLAGSRTGMYYAAEAVVLRDPPLLYASPVQHIMRQSITVFDPPLAQFNDENEFLFSLPPTSNLQSADPLLCRCHMKAVHLDKRPLEGYRLHVRQMFTPEALHEVVPEQGIRGSVVGGDRLALVSDKEGMMFADLVRGGLYQAFSMSRAEASWLFRVPHLPIADLADLLYLSAKEIVFDSNAVSLGVGEEAIVPVASLVMSDETSEDLEGNHYAPSRYISPVSSDLDALTLSWGSTEGTGSTPAQPALLILAKSAGTFTVTFTPQGSAKSGLPVRYPMPPLVYGPITVTVT